MRPRQVYVDGVERTGGIVGAPAGTLTVDPTSRTLVASAASGTEGAFLSLPAVKGRFVLTLDVFEAPRDGRVDLVRFPSASPAAAVHVWVEGDRVSVGAEGGKPLAGFGRPPGPFTVYLSNDRFGVALASQEPMTVAVSLPIAATEVLVGVGPPVTPAPTAARIDDVWIRPAP